MKSIFFSGVLLLSTVLGSQAFAADPIGLVSQANPANIKFKVVCAATNIRQVNNLDGLASLTEDKLNAKISKISNVLEVSLPSLSSTELIPFVCVTVKHRE